MKTVILAGGFGSRICEECPVVLNCHNIKLLLKF